MTDKFNRFNSSTTGSTGKKPNIFCACLMFLCTNVRKYFSNKTSCFWSWPWKYTQGKGRQGKFIYIAHFVYTEKNNADTVEICNKF